MWSMILLMSRLSGGHSMSVGRRSKKNSATNSRQSASNHYQAIGAIVDWVGRRHV